MSHRLSLFSRWLVLHRCQIQMAIIMIALALTFLSSAVPQFRTLAEEMPGGGH
jgi:hypothetical protein